ncbi:hypothetical protein FLL45_04880 [Aliikangiella marina]|uniref:Uncharacterized protein n=1 Tax=Aliikangiella marina TaxID=1712262 RepID=A0A545TJ97_9GAMM|nr:hypothetical protein [Aliikangiella marina]TQV77283.1 hypothetical protein FLL45_04880 [Aliikangiella marina]
MKKYEIESVEGVGYLLFERTTKDRTRRIGDIFKNVAQAKSYIGSVAADVELIYHCAYEEMINGDEQGLDLVTKT